MTRRSSADEDAMGGEGGREGGSHGGGVLVERTWVRTEASVEDSHRMEEGGGGTRTRGRVGEGGRYSQLMDDR